MLYCVATPIGNLKDFTPRALETLALADCILAEDTRVTGSLLSKYNISKPFLSLQSFNERSRCSEVIYRLKQGQTLALVTDAGTPCISDPGYRLVEAVRAADFDVIPIPGVSAITTLLSVAGFDVDRFHFLGFIPRKETELLNLLKSISPKEWPLVGYESPKRIEKTVARIASEFPEAHLVLGKELTKHHEVILSDTAVNMVDRLNQVTIKGEWCIAVQLNIPTQDIDYRNIVKELSELGLNRTQILSVGNTFLNAERNNLYQAYIEFNNQK